MNKTPINDKLWHRHNIEPIGLSIEVYQAWPVESMPLENGKNIYQRISDTGGLLFLRYGSGETMERFLSALGDYVTEVRIISDEQMEFVGQPARRVVIRLDRQKLSVYMHQEQGGPLHVEEPETHTIISVIAFQRRGISILAGYRLLEERITEFRPILERFISGIVLEKPDAAEK
jgi:hypothetical protein